MMSMGLGKDTLKCAYVVGPVTLAGLLETAERVAMDSILEPDRLKVLCSFATKIIQKYAHAMINAGADIICILEPTATILGPKEFKKFSSYYVRYIIESYKYAKNRDRVSYMRQYNSPYTGNGICRSCCA